jgi:hypothetical protein
MKAAIPGGGQRVSQPTSDRGWLDNRHDHHATALTRDQSSPAKMWPAGMRTVTHRDLGCQGRERYLASPMVDHTSAGSSYLPADQLTAWGQGIAQVARQLTG